MSAVTVHPPVYFVNFVPKGDPANYWGYSQGLGVLSALMRRRGWRPRWVYVPDDDLDAAAVTADGAPVFAYVTTNGYRAFAEVLRAVWSPAGVPVVVGGPHATALPEEVAALPGVSAVCVGEGERAAMEIADRLERNERDFSGVTNTVVDTGREVVRGPQGAVVEDLDALPFCDREEFPFDRVLRTKAGRLVGLEFLATRGCTYGCRFCINPLLRKVHGKALLRRRSVSSVIAEVRQALERFPYRGPVGFHDDIFTLDRRWLAEFAAEFPRQVGRPFWCNTHIADLDEEVVRTLRRAGCFRVLVGIECGDEAQRAQVLGKRISNEEIMEKTALLHRHHIKIVATFMIGLPDETEAHIQASIDLCRQIRPAWVLLSSLCPYPGTRLYRDLVAQGRLDPHFYRTMDADTFYAPHRIYDQGPLSLERIAYYHAHFRRLAGVL